MTRLGAWLFHMANGLVAATGLAYAWAAYLVRNEDPFAVVNHPLQPHFQHAHILVAPLLVFMLGHLWQRHSLRHYRMGTKQGRRTGVSMILLALPMVLSGYLIQAAVEPVWRTVWVWIHLATSVAWLAGSAGHLLRHRLMSHA